MRKRRPGYGGWVPYIALALGALIILLLLLPPGFLWFLLGLGLIAGGIWAIRCS